MRAVVLVLCVAGCASQGPTIHRSYQLPGAFTPYRVAAGFPLVLAATRQIYPIEATRPDRGALLTAPHRSGADEVAFLVWVAPERVRSIAHGRGRVHVELDVTVETIINRQLVPPERVPSSIVDEEKHLLAVISDAGERYESAMVPQSQ